MWDFLYFYGSVRMIIMAIILLPMIAVGAVLRKNQANKPYYNKLGMMAHFYSIAMCVAMVLGDFYIGYFEFELLTYVIGVAFALVLAISYVIYFLVVRAKYNKSFIEIK